MNTLVWKRRIGRIAGHMPRSRDRRIVLMYHSIGESPWAVRETDFREQVRRLESARVCTLDALLHDEASSGLRVALTFDDGYASLASTAADILSEAGMVATVYLNTGLVDECGHRSSDPNRGHYPDETFLSWGDVRNLHRVGWTIGSHGVEHLDLTARPMDRVIAEVAMSKRDIEDRVGAPCEHFSYTWGRNDAQVRAAVRDAGYLYAAAAVHGPVRTGFDPYAIPRLNVHRDYSLADFAALLRGDWDFVGWWQALGS